MATRTQIADAAFALLNVRENESDVDTDNSVRARRFRVLFDSQLQQLLKSYKWPFLQRSAVSLKIDPSTLATTFNTDKFKSFYFFPDGTSNALFFRPVQPNRLLRVNWQTIEPCNVQRYARKAFGGIISEHEDDEICYEYYADIGGDTTLLPDTFAPVLYHKMASLLASPLGRPAEQAPQDVKYQQALQEMKLAFSIEEGPAHVIFDDTAVLGRFGGIGIGDREGDGP